MSQETRLRLVFGLIAGLILCAILLFGDPNIVLGCCLILGLIGWKEYAHLTGLKKWPLSHWVGVICVLGLIYLHANQMLRPSVLGWVAIANFSALALSTWHPKRAPTTDVLWRMWLESFTGCLYIFFLFGFIPPIAQKEAGNLWIFLALSVVFFGDTAAYVVGRRWGSRKLWAAVSPGKTIEGALGGIVGSLLAAMLCKFLFESLFPHLEISWLKLIVFAVLAAPLAQMGDLLESLLKRAKGYKDSGHFLPGHGGLLDRCDGLVFVFALLYQMFF